jgi:hypothetical protein
MKKIAITTFSALLVLVGAVTFLPLRAIAGLETPCNYISDLVATNPLSSDLASTSDDHHRCIKLALKTTFPNINAAVNATDENLNALSASLTASGILELEAAATRLIIDETDAASNERIYDWASSAGQLLGRTRTDADGAGATWLTVDRTGTTVDSIALAATAITLNGVAASDFARLSQSNTFTSSSQAIVASSASPTIAINETDGAVDNRRWDILANGEALSVRAVNDAISAASDVLTVQRTGTTVDSINLQATAVQVNGRTIPRFAFGSVDSAGGCSASIASTNVSTCTRTGAGAYTITFSSAFGTAPSCTLSTTSSSGGMQGVSSTSTTAINITSQQSFGGAALDATIRFICLGF